MKKLDLILSVQDHLYLAAPALELELTRAHSEPEPERFPQE